MVTITLGIMITTAQRIPERGVREYLGLVSGEAIGELQDAGAQVATLGDDEVRSGAGASAFQRARQRALCEMARRASEHGATIVIGVDIGYAAVGPGALLVSATGTAARL
jgi:uncharacterized protein YbjQ (UPF0145 family)